MKTCDHLHCQEEGLYPAPKSRGLRPDYFHFCLEHVREYNKSWDYFKGMCGAEIRAHQFSDITWRRPTWSLKETQRFFNHVTEHPFFTEPIGILHHQSSYKIPIPKGNSSEAQAMRTLDLDQLDSYRSLKQRYLSLVKTYHPDKNDGCKRSEEKLKKITVAYRILSNYLKKFQCPTLKKCSASSA